MRLFLILLLLVTVTQARWPRRGRSSQPKETSFVGKATEEFSTALLQNYIDFNNKNIAFSPIAYTLALAMLAEGAQGETRKQLATALHLPEDREYTRKTFKDIMQNTIDFKYSTPEIDVVTYKAPIDDNYLQILKNNYFQNSSFTNYTKHHREGIVDYLEMVASDVENKPVEINGTNTAYEPANNTTEKIKLIKESEKETIVADEARRHAKCLFIRDQRHLSIYFWTLLTSDTTPEPEKAILIYKGLFFEGSWKKPFEREEPGVFHLSSEEKKQVTMMKSNAPYKIGWFPELDSEAIELPYDNDRHVFLLIMPRTRDGLPHLIKKLSETSLADIQYNLQEETVNVSIPIFSVAAIEYNNTFDKIGSSGIFGPEPNLSGIGTDLFVSQFKQIVYLTVDTSLSKNSSASEMNAENTAETNLTLADEKPSRVFSVEHPFIFYMIDQIDNIIVLTGKVTDIEKHLVSNSVTW